MKKKIKKVDGTIAEVEEAYSLQTGEEILKESDAVDLPQAIGTIAKNINDGLTAKLEAFSADQKKTVSDTVQTLLKDELAKMPINAPDFFKNNSKETAKAELTIKNRAKLRNECFGANYNSHIVPFESFSDGDPLNKFAMGLSLLRRGDKRFETYLAVTVEEYTKRMNDLLGYEGYAQSLTDADGGYLAPPEFELMVLMQLGKYGLFRRFVPVFPTGAKTQNLTALDSAITGYWVAEGADITTSQFSLSRPTNDLNKLAINVTGTREFWEDAQEVRNVIDQQAAEVMDRMLDIQWLRGTGAPFTGITGVTGGNFEVIGGATVTGGSTLLREDIINAKYNLEDYNRAGSIWVMNKAMLKECENILDLNNRPLFNSIPSQLGNGDGIDEGYLAGYKVYASPAMPSAPGPNTVFAVLFNPAEVTRARARAGIIVDVSNTATDSAGFNNWLKDGQSVRFIYRIGIFNLVKEDIDGSQTAVSGLKTAAA